MKIMNNLKDFKVEEEFGLSVKRLDFYTGEEKISFRNRHPIFKTLMKLEFEDVIRNYLKKENSK